MSEPNSPAADNAKPKKFSRDDIRSAFLDSKPQSHPLNVFGVDVLLVEPTTNELLSLQSNEDRKAAMAQMMITYVRTADGEPVFDETDVDGLLSVPYGKEMQKLNRALNELVGTSAAPTDDSKSQASS